MYGKLLLFNSYTVARTIITIRMNFSDLIKSRYSCREFKDIPIGKEDLQFVLDVVTSAPTAGNLQAYAAKVVLDKEDKIKLTHAAYGQDFILQAPVVLVFFAVPELSAVKYGDRGANLYCIQDATIACTYAQLAATDLGLGSCWVGAFNEKIVKQCLNTEWSWKAISILPIGYPLRNIKRSSKVSKIIK